MASTMPQTLRQVVAQAKQKVIEPAVIKNGSGHFLQPCRKMVFNYCERSGSSKGMLVMCMRKRTPEEISVATEKLKNFSGNKNRLWKKPTVSDTPSVRGIWSPFHSKTHKITDLKTK
ncbi:39S ribosomal protein L51, mitochondrial [Mycoemilia scoparia]|uniref:39S ribosomal protein L51, mitochondrial n=1 Tax=Mycoemilia scoparia TaxID=417184 RepID=A0A9W7ZVX4_9FUNG|nr:39S ribosomal protein L51, mitochondrial [Mycoemilia scoparia]